MTGNGNGYYYYILTATRSAGDGRTWSAIRRFFPCPPVPPRFRVVLLVDFFSPRRSRTRAVTILLRRPIKGPRRSAIITQRSERDLRAERKNDIKDHNNDGTFYCCCQPVRVCNVQAASTQQQSANFLIKKKGDYDGGKCVVFFPNDSAEAID